jgi:hypothetical protein
MKFLLKLMYDNLSAFIGNSLIVYVIDGLMRNNLKVDHAVFLFTLAVLSIYQNVRHQK